MFVKFGVMLCYPMIVNMFVYFMETLEFSVRI